MSRTDTALKPFVENSSSAAHRIASRKLGLRAADSSLADGQTMICTNVQIIRSSQQTCCTQFKCAKARSALTWHSPAHGRVKSAPVFDAAVHRVPPAGTAFIGSMVNKTLSGTGPRRQKADRNEGFAAE